MIFIFLVCLADKITTFGGLDRRGLSFLEKLGVGFNGRAGSGTAVFSEPLI